MNRPLLSPFQKFVRIESFGGILLVGSTILALLWANSSLGGSYESLWNYQIGIKTPDFELVKPLRLWVNDGLMTIFFFLIGLEIKRELLVGELNSVRKAAFPFLAALGGMLAPAFIFLVLNRNPETLSGWGIPIATDIAFSLAILRLLGKRIPLSLKVFLTAFAIVDDLGAVIVIALFYGHGLNWILLISGLAVIFLLALIIRAHLYSKYLVLIFGLIAWVLFLKSGIHPTIAGVFLAFTVPILQRTDLKTYSENLSSIASDLQNCPVQEKPILTSKQIGRIDDLESLTLQVQSPLQHLEHKLHNWVAWLIMPLFALANAGVVIANPGNMDFSLIFNLSASLIVGKSLGITLFSYIGLKTRIIELPAGVNMKQVTGVALLAGVGFTMSLFIAGLAFSGNTGMTDSAKLGILGGSLISGLAGYLVLRNISDHRPSKDENPG